MWFEASKPFIASRPSYSSGLYQIFVSAVCLHYGPQLLFLDEAGVLHVTHVNLQFKYSSAQQTDPYI